MLEQYSDKMAKNLGFMGEQGALFVVVDQVGAVLEENVAVDPSCEVIVGKIRAADDHVVIEDVALDVVHAQDFVPSRRQELRHEVFGKHRRVQIHIMSPDHKNTKQTFPHTSCRGE